ncbi:MAG: hypothetical protein U1F10_00470 [Burkholderiales bacterium]
MATKGKQQSAFEKVVSKLREGRGIAERLQSIEDYYSDEGIFTFYELSENLPTTTDDREYVLDLLRALANDVTQLANDIQAADWDDEKVMAIEEKRDSKMFAQAEKAAKSAAKKPAKRGSK